MFKKYCVALLAALWAFQGFSQLALPEGTAKKPFYSLVDRETSKGKILIESRDSKGVTMRFEMAWSSNNFLCKYIAIGGERVDRWTGVWGGEAWEYYKGDLIWRKAPAVRREELIEEFQGRVPEEHTLNRLFGRGTDIKRFSAIQVLNNGKIRFRWQAHVHALGEVNVHALGEVKEITPTEAHYTYELEGLPVKYIHHVSLIPLAGGFIPERLESWLIEQSSTNKVYDYFVRIMPFDDQIFNPVLLFPGANHYESIEGVLYKVSQTFSGKENPVNTNRFPLRIIILIALIFIAILGSWWRYANK